VLVLVLLAVFGSPVLAVVGSAIRSPERFTAFQESDRLRSLAANTLGLAAVAVGIAVSLGTLLALVTERFPLKGRFGIRVAVLAGLFVPLPVYALAWQAVLSGWIPPLSLSPGAVAWRAWNVGLLPAGFVHGMAGVPWVAWIVSEVLARTDRDLEEDALLTGGPWFVLRRVVLPRVVPAVLLAGGWVLVQTITEIPVTDAMMVRTFAEEVYTQLVSDGNGLASAVAVTVPVWGGGILAGLLTTRRMLVSPTTSNYRSLPFSRGAGRLAALFAWGVVGVFAGIPLLALVRTAGGSEFSTGVLGRHLATVLQGEWVRLVVSIVSAAVAGMIAAALARRACWAAVRSRWFAGFLYVVCVVLFLTPGPLIGLGLKVVISGLLDIEDGVFAVVGWRPTFPPLASLLYTQSSPLPGIWATVIRLFPVACVVMRPTLQAVPGELWEAVAVDGHGWRGAWRLVAEPFTRRASVSAAVAVAALALGEVSASKLVAPPGAESFIQRLFAQMHYGAESTVAALALVQVTICLLIAVGFRRSPEPHS
jgi:iron(III) transport system permease protein